jgi:hypothetical protein
MTQVRLRTPTLLHLGEAVKAHDRDVRTPEMRRLEIFGQLLDQDLSAGQDKLPGWALARDRRCLKDEANRKLVGGLSAHHVGVNEPNLILRSHF